MQTQPDLGLLQFAEIAIGLLQLLVEIAGQAGQRQLLQLLRQLLTQQQGPLGTELAGLPVLIEQRLQSLQLAIKPGPAQGWGEVIQDHRLGTPLGLAALTRIIDDERIEVRQRTQGPFREAAGGEAQALAGQPFEVAVLAHMHHHLGSKLLPQPEVLGQVGVGGGQVGAVIAEAGVAVVAPGRLDQQHDPIKPQAPNRKGGCAAGVELQLPIRLRRPPDGFQTLATGRRQALVPKLVVGEAQLAQGRPVAALRIVAAAGQQGPDQGIAIGRQGSGAEAVALLRQPGEHQGDAGGGVQTHPIGEPAVAGGVVGEHQGHAALGSAAAPQLDPVVGEGHDPLQPLRIGLQALQRRAQPIAGPGHLLEGPHPGGDPAIQFRQGDLQAEIERSQADAALLPAALRPATTEQLQHGQLQALPERRAEAGVFELDGGEAGAAEHRLGRFALQQITHTPLYGGIPQAAHPQRPRRQALGSEFLQAGLHQRQITGLQQGAIQNQPHPRPWIRPPVVGQRIRTGMQLRWLGHDAVQQAGNTGQQGLQVGGAPLT